MPDTEFAITGMVESTYRPLFTSTDVPMWVATVEAADHTFTFSHRLDDPALVWYADCLILPSGMPAFVHGDGDRLVAKSRASEELEKRLNAYLGAMF